MTKLKLFSEKVVSTDKMYKELILSASVQSAVESASQVAEIENDVKPVIHIQRTPKMKVIPLQDKPDEVKSEKNIDFLFSQTVAFQDENDDDLEKKLEDIQGIMEATSDKEKAAVKSSFQCNHCERFYTRRQTLEEHIRLKHSTTEQDLPFQCSTCPKKFVNEKKLKQHATVHLPPEKRLVYPCGFCDKKFTKSVNLNVHIRVVHQQQRPFVCETCGKNFQTKGSLKDHQVTHSDLRGFDCKFCPKKFKNQARLKTHEDIHNNTSYVCPHCGLQLNTKRTLKMHLVVHSDEKKYKCQYCFNEYKRSKALKAHLILHTGLRPYVCPFCQKTFANGSNCRSHKKKAHPAELAALEASGGQQQATTVPTLDALLQQK